MLVTSAPTNGSGPLVFFRQSTDLLCIHDKMFVFPLYSLTMNPGRLAACIMYAIGLHCRRVCRHHLGSRGQARNDLGALKEGGTKKANAKGYISFIIRSHLLATEGPPRLARRRDGVIKRKLDDRNALADLAAADANVAVAAVRVILLDRLGTGSVRRAGGNQLLAAVERRLVKQRPAVAVDALLPVAAAGDALVVGAAELLLVDADAVDLDAPAHGVVSILLPDVSLAAWLT